MANISKEERARREAEARKDEQAEAGITGIDLRAANPREPVPNVAPDAEPATPARGADPVGTPGTVDPSTVVEGDPVKEAEARVEAGKRVEYRRVRMKHGYFPGNGKTDAKGTALPGKMEADAEYDLRIEDARHLVESGIAQLVDSAPDEE